MFFFVFCFFNFFFWAGVHKLIVEDSEKCRYTGEDQSRNCINCGRPTPMQSLHPAQFEMAPCCCGPCARTFKINGVWIAWANRSQLFGLGHWLKLKPLSSLPTEEWGQSPIWGSLAPVCVFLGDSLYSYVVGSGLDVLKGIGLKYTVPIIYQWASWAVEKL